LLCALSKDENPYDQAEPIVVDFDRDAIVIRVNDAFGVFKSIPVITCIFLGSDEVTIIDFQGVQIDDFDMDQKHSFWT
jgi:hypothetical protein